MAQSPEQVERIERVLTPEGIYRPSLLELIRRDIDKKVEKGEAVLAADFPHGKTHPLRPSSRVSHNFLEIHSIIVSPNPAIFDLSKLNQFMRGLTDIEPNSWSDAEDKHNIEVMTPGRLYFNDLIGIKRVNSFISIVTRDEEAMRRAGQKTGSYVETSQAEVFRQIVIVVYPEPDLTKLLGGYINGVHNRTLKRSRWLDDLTLTGIPLSQLREDPQQFVHQLRGHLRPKP